MLRLKKWMPLLLLTVAGFTFNTSELTPIGLLTDIADSFGVSESDAGLLISVYASVVALLSLPLMLLCARMEMRQLLISIVALFVASHIGSFLSTGYYTLMASRIGVACAHSIFWSIAPPMAVAVTADGKRATAISALMAGGGIALVAGLPLGRVLGLIAGWRVTFGALGLLATLILIGLLRFFPKIKQEANNESRTDILLNILHNRGLLMIYLITAIIVTGHYTCYSYIEPFMDSILNMEAMVITYTLCLFGVAGLAGSYIMTRWFSRYPQTFIKTSCICLPAAMLALQPVSNLGIVPLAVLCLLWGLAMTIYNIAFQNEVIELSPHNSAVAMSIYSGIFNLGIGSGALVGGITCSGGLLAEIGYIGGAIALSAAIFCLLRYLPTRHF